MLDQSHARRHALLGALIDFRGLRRDKADLPGVVEAAGFVNS